MVDNIYAFFGVDGVGKTTTIEGIKKRLENKGENVLVFRMNRAGDHKIPFIKKFMRLKANYLKKKKGLDPKKDILLVDIYRKRSLFFLIIYYIDFLLRYKEIKRLSKKNVILLDRYFYDGLALTSKKYLPFFSKITPRPTKSFFLWAPPEVILKRKQEATKQNMEEYSLRVENEFNKYFNIEKINTSMELKKVLNKIESSIKHA